MARIDLIINAKSTIRGAIAKAKAQLENFGKKAKKVSKSIKNAFGAIGKAVGLVGGAIGAAATAAIRASNKQELAESQLTSALSARGDEVAALVPRYKQLAAAIQDETAIGDEATLTNIAQLRTLGVSNDQMERAIKMHIGLKKAGMGSDTALRATAAALEGNTSMLTRYVPALRKAETEAEKMAIVEDLAARGYKTQSDELNTTTGRIEEFKGRLGDAAEELGEALKNSSGFNDILATMSEKVKDVGQAISDWADDGGMDTLIYNAKLFGVEFVTMIEKVVASVKGFGGVVHAGLIKPLQGFVDAVMNVVTPAGMAIAEIMKGNFRLAKEYATQAVTNMKNEGAKLFDRSTYQGYADNIVSAVAEAADEVAQIEEDKQKKISEINEKYNKQQQERVKRQEEREKERREAEERMAKKAIEQRQAEENEKRNAAIAEAYYASHAAEEAVEAKEKEGKADDELAKKKQKNAQDVIKSAQALAKVGLSDMTEGEADQLKRALEALQDAKPVPDLNLEELRDVDLPNFTSGEADQLKRAINALAGAKPLPDLNLDELIDVELPDIDAFEAGKFKMILANLAKTKPVPDLGLKQFNEFAKIDAKQIKDIADAVQRINGIKAEIILGGDATNHLGAIKASTNQTAANTRELKNLLVLR